MINLLPPKDRHAIALAKKNSILRRYIELCLVSALVLLVLLAGSYYYLKQQENNIQQTADLNKQKVAQLEPVQEEAEQLATTMSTISALLARDVSFSNMLRDIGKLMPSGSSLTGLELSSVESDAPLSISAQVENEQTVAILRNNLASSSLFEKAEIKSIVRKGEEETSETQKQSEKDEDEKESRYQYTATLEAYFKAKKDTR